MSVAEILEQIERLPLAERQIVVEKILEKYDAVELTAEEAAELDRRLAEFEKNPTAGVPWKHVEANVPGAARKS